MAARRWLTTVLRPTPVTKMARQRGERTSEHGRIKRGTPKGLWFDGEAEPHAQYYGGAPLTSASSPFRLSHEGVGHYIFGGGTTTDGAPHAHPISAKDQTTERERKELAHTAMATVARARYGSRPFRTLQFKSRGNIFT
jgi:hypothetical protein